MCSRKIDGTYYFKDGTVNNAIELTKELMTKYNIPIENVIRHYDVTGKNCPEPFVRIETHWQEFKNKLQEGLEVTEESKIIVNGKEVSIRRILKDGTNYIAIRDVADALGYEIGNQGSIAVLTKK